MFPFPPIDYQNISYYAAPKVKDGPKSLDDIDPEIRKTYEKLGIPLDEQMMLAGVAVDAVFDSVSVITTFKEKLAEAGVIFCSISEAVREHPELVKKYLGFVVPQQRQLLCGAEFGCIHGRLIRVHPQGRPLPHGALDILQNKR